MGILSFFRGLYGKKSSGRYHIDEVNYVFNSSFFVEPGKDLTTLKFDMSYITGKVYCDAGTIGYHKNGKKDGVHKMFKADHVDDPIIYTGLWDMGSREGSHKWFDAYNDKEVHEINYKNNILDGLERKWDRNGQLRNQIEWKSGTIITWRQWDVDGNLTLDGEKKEDWEYAGEFRTRSRR